MTFEIATNDPEAPKDKQIRWVAARGGIVRDTPKAFDAFLAKNDIAGLTIYFDSPGGSILGGLELGDRLRKIEAKVSIGRSTPVGPADMQGSAAPPQPRRHHLAPNAGQCNSACSYAFLGGATRTVPANAFYGVHMYWPTEKVEGLHQQSYTVQDVENAQRTSARIAAYIQRMGVDLRMFEIASSVPHRAAMRRLTNREIVDFKIASIDHTAPVLAKEGAWGLTIGRASATLVTGGPLKDDRREGALYQLELSCSDTPGFEFARFELSLTKALEPDRALAMRRVLIASGQKDAVLAVSGKDVRPIPATFNRLSTRGAGGWVAKAGTIVAEVTDNAVRRPSDGLRMVIDEGEGVTTIVPIAIGNLADQHRRFVAACAAFRERRPAPTDQAR